MGANRTNSSLILETLKKMGPLCISDISKNTEIRRRSVDESCRFLRHNEPKEIYIKKWLREGDPIFGKPYMVLAAGNMPCAKKPAKSDLPRVQYKKPVEKKAEPIKNKLALPITFSYNSSHEQLIGYDAKNEAFKQLVLSVRR